jgi:addiction module HigA family antidote
MMIGRLFGHKRMSRRLDAISPSEILLEEFLKPAGMSQNFLAWAIDVPVGRINDIVRGKRGIKRDTAVRLAVFFGTSPDLWINLQARFDSKIARRDLMPRVAKRIRARSLQAA